MHTAVLHYDSFRRSALASDLAKCGLRKYALCDGRLIDRTLGNYLKDIAVQGSNTLAEDMIAAARRAEHYLAGIVKPDADAAQKLRQQYHRSLEESQEAPKAFFRWRRTEPGFDLTLALSMHERI